MCADVGGECIVQGHGEDSSEEEGEVDCVVCKDVPYRQVFLTAHIGDQDYEKNMVVGSIVRVAWPEVAVIVLAKLHSLQFWE